MNIADSVDSLIVETLWWVAAVAVTWLVVSLAIGLLIGGATRMRDRVGAPSVAARRAKADDRPGAARPQPRLFRLG